MHIEEDEHLNKVAQSQLKNMGESMKGQRAQRDREAHFAMQERAGVGVPMGARLVGAPAGPHERLRDAADGVERPLREARGADGGVVFVEELYGETVNRDS